ncbi:hypothetical protein NQZ68_035139 [Xyrichtys novacula]|uniref:Uncharacterized protein n=1 Tax=Xyrichtys novacula TaxID=13765 RepID=A0AAV1HF16_XYRNO|nr:hypothetical protein NQZ68_035139 [Xyrichtys novacula]
MRPMRGKWASAAGPGQTAEGGPNVQPGRSVDYRELAPTIHRSSQLTDEQPVRRGLGYTDWHRGSAVPDETIGGQKT